ncbi:recombination directionality factor [Streptomyces sp. NPDC001667]
MTRSTPTRAGRFHQGRLSEGRWPQSLDAWRVTTSDSQVASRVADLMGGQSNPNDGGGDHSREVLTARESVRILIDGPEMVTARMVLWRSKRIVHECDGSEFLSPEELKGQPCGCPPLLADRKAEARAGRGPMPSIDLVFRIAADPSLGEFHFRTSSWKAAEQLSSLMEELERVGGPAVCDLTTELVLLTTKNGTTVGYRKPVVTVLGSPDTVAPEPPPAPAPPAVLAPPSNHRKRDRRPKPPAPSGPEPTCSVDLDIALLNRAAQVLGTTGHRETVIAALSEALESRQRAAEVDRLRECVKRIATTAGQALQAGGSPLT